MTSSFHLTSVLIQIQSMLGLVRQNRSNRKNGEDFIHAACHPSM